nr:competence/damage-inducible protein A [uncultured Oscillibacter sp.]
MSHTAEIIAVGTELLLGNIANTNAQSLSQALSSLGINVFWHTVVGDNPNRLREALLIAQKRANVLITTGGLGPTYDDLTKQTICEVFGKTLVLHQDILDDIQSLYERVLHVSMPENNTQQALLPKGCTVFDNPVGTAPGCAFEEGGAHVLMLPGPPNEMNVMLQRCVIPYLRQLSKEVIVSHDIMTFGMGEALIDDLLHEQMSHMKNPTLATYAKPCEVLLRATAKADTSEQANAMLTPVVDKICGLLGDVVYGMDVAGLEETCLKLLTDQGLTFAVAEGCTGGRIAERFTALPGSAAVFLGGVSACSTQVKRDVLRVPKEVLDTYGPVSAEAAKAMAQGARRIAGADIGVSVTDALGLDEQDTPISSVYVGLSTSKATFCRKIDAGRRRDRIRGLACNHAFDMIRRYLTGLDVEITNLA